MKLHPLAGITAISVVVLSALAGNVFGQTGSLTGNQALENIMSETNSTPLKLYPQEYLDQLEAIGDNLLPIMPSIPLRPIRSEPVGPLIVDQGSSGGFGMRAMARPAPSDPVPEYTYTVTDLGTLGGSMSAASSINNSGKIVGYAYASVNRPALFTAPITDLGTLGGSDGSALSINANSVIVGSAALGNGNDNAFMWDGSMHGLGTLGGQQSAAYSINTGGQITGLSEISGGGQHAFLYSGSMMSDIGTFPSWSGVYGSIGYGIDDFGDIVGTMATNSPTRGFIKADGTMIDIGTLGGSEAGAYAVNSYGETVGYSTTSAGAHHAFFYDYQGGTMEDLGVLTGATSSDAYGMNNAASVVGSSGGHAFLVSNGSMKDLNDLVITSSPGWVLQNAQSINDKGQIVGYGLNPSGQVHAFLLNPLPDGAVDASANVIPTQQTFGVLPVKDPTKDSLIVITHGWYSIVDPRNIYPIFPPDLKWMDDMSGAISSSLASKGINNWQVYDYKWVDGAWVYHPMDALNNAKKEGQNLGKSIVAQGWTHVHFISHSAGAELIQSATDVIKDTINGSPSTVVHETFLDPFVGSKYEGIVTYGRGADWADQYFAKDKLTEIDPFDVSLFSIAPYTESPVFHSYNVDVTALDSHKTPYTKFASSPDGAQIAETCTDTETSHGWPIDFYMNTIAGNLSTVYDGQDYDGFGFPLSEESINWIGRSAYTAGNGTSIQPSVPTKILGTPDSACTIVGTLSTLSYPDLKPDATLLPVWQSVTGFMHRYNDHIDGGSGSPAWLSMAITHTNPINYIAFDANFTSGAGAQGVLTVLWDTNIIGTLDERAVLSGFQHYQFTFPNAEANSSHVLGLRLDPFTNIQSTITLTNIVLNQVGASQQPTLSATTNVVNGLRVWRLDGEAGFNYNVLASSDPSNTNWATIAILANTNGTVFFYDQDSTNYTQRFYRAVAQ